MALKIASLNSRGLSDYKKRREVFLFLKKKNISIALLQETHSKLSDETQWNREWGGSAYFSHGNTRSRGVSVLVSARLDHKLNDIVQYENGRYINLDITVQNYRMGIVCLYGHTEDNPDFFENLFAILQNLQCENWIIGGDFNLVIDDKLDKAGGRGGHKNVRARRTICNLMEEFGLSDIYRLKHPNEKRYSHIQKSPKVLTRIDFF